MTLPSEITTSTTNPITSVTVSKDGTLVTVTPTVTYSDPAVLEIDNIFGSVSDGNELSYSEIVVTIDSLTNPRSTATTSSFIIETTDADDNPIENANSLVTITMTSQNELLGFTADPVDTTNGITT